MLAQIELAQATRIDMQCPFGRQLPQLVGQFLLRFLRCAGLCAVVDHRRINGSLFLFSAAILALFVVSALEGLIGPIMSELISTDYESGDLIGHSDVTCTMLAAAGARSQL